ncbi:MAG: rod shape-determining protein RodA [Rhodospirillales bacterium]|nr:rod shape-determining protein RodA [Rhodospirillales bacterium]
MSLDALERQRLTVPQKLLQIRWLFVFAIVLVAGVGAGMLVSAANGSFQPWAVRHIVRFGVCAVFMMAIAVTDVRIWLRYAYWIYAGVLALLVAVEIAGSVGMGAQRWIDLGVINLQPSELMKTAVVLALARYFHGVDMEDIGRPLLLVVPLALVAAPTVLVLKQPDLGTSLMLLAAGGAVFFAAGVRLWKFALVIAAAGGVMPVLWGMLHDYQRQRVLTFLDPESDPLGSGYHIIQSKIALGSGGLLGKGYLQGTQSHLNFLPERQTDFIFTMLAEEFGLVGGVGLMVLYLVVMAYGFAIALSSRNQFGRLLAVGLTTTFFLYVFINMAMVMGLIPVVGVPLPLISYGGTAMMALMIGFGLMLSVYVHRDVMIGRKHAGEEI